MKILVVRFSALGDVAMTIPVVWSLAETYPELEICVLTRESFVPLFYDKPANVRFIGADFNYNHKGLKGLHRLYYEKLAGEHFDYIADLHGVMRTFLLDFRFRLAGKKVAAINKGRKVKRRILKESKRRGEGEFNAGELSSKSMILRYCDVFKRLGFALPDPLPFKSIFLYRMEAVPLDTGVPAIAQGKKPEDVWIGIAPFARYEGKTYPIDRMERVVKMLSEIPHVHIFLFGSALERETLMDWTAEHPHKIHIPFGLIDMDKELLIMTQLDLMIAMDSANMHLASLVGLRVLSIWGATHPCTGFMGYGQQLSDVVQENMPCRPCSVFGNKPCRYKNYACMTAIQPETIVRQARTMLNLS